MIARNDVPLNGVDAGRGQAPGLARLPDNGRNAPEPGRVEILGVGLDALTRRELLEQVLSIVRSAGRAQIMYANAHVLNTAYGDPELRHVLNQADLVYCDGAGARWAARLLGQQLPERMTGADWIYDLCRLCQDQGIRLYILAGEPGVAAQAADRLQLLYPRLQIAGTHQGYFEHTGPENAAIIAQINAAHPDILLVGLGTPHQEKWIARSWEQLDLPVVWAVGAVVDYVVGKQPRAPGWMLEHDLEWLGRLASDPQRLWKRYLLGNPLFLYRVVRQRVSRRVRQ